MKPQSLVLITVDCLRADHVGFLGYSRPITPFLDSLAQQSLVFTDAIVGGVPTYFSFPAIFASRPPLALGRDVFGIAPHEPTLTTALANAGYVTAAFLAGNPYLTARFGYDQGFEEFRDFLDAASVAPLPLAQDGFFSSVNRWLQARSSRTGISAAVYEELYFRYCQWRLGHEQVTMDALRRYPAADVIVNEACNWLRGLRDRPFFLWLHLMDPHHPYYPPDESFSSRSLPITTARRARFLNSLWNRGHVGVSRLSRYKSEIISLYDAGVYWVDQQIARLVDSLKQLELWDNSVVAVTADHGEEFLEHGLRYHSPVNLSEQLIHVPLLLRAPSLSPPKFMRAPFSLVHLAPTLLDAVGASVPTSFQGVSHWSQICGGEVPSEPAIVECVQACENPFERDDRLRPRLLAVRDHTLKLVINFREKKDALYDLKNDSSEQSPLGPNVHVEGRARLLKIAHAHLQKTSHNRNVELRLRGLLREIQRSASLTL